LPIARGQPIFLDQAADLVLDIPANGHKPGTGENFNTLRDFCDERGLSKHGHSVTWEHEWYQVFMFAVEEHAEIFRKEFGGERMQPHNQSSTEQVGYERAPDTTGARFSEPRRALGPHIAAAKKLGKGQKVSSGPTKN
jgi:hypothetical protein